MVLAPPNPLRSLAFDANALSAMVGAPDIHDIELVRSGDEQAQP